MQIKTEKEVRRNAQWLMDNMISEDLTKFSCTGVKCDNNPRILCVTCPLNNQPFENYNNMRGSVLGLY